MTIRTAETERSRHISGDDFSDLAIGAAVLGGGGGGDPHIGELLARDAACELGPVTLVPLEDVPDDALVVLGGVVGAPTVLIEKLVSVEALLRAFDAIAGYLGRPITHTIAAECGGVNSLFPFVVAAHRGLPVVDADLIGRAFPEVQMTIPTLYGIPATPFSIADEKGNVIVFEAADNHWTERIARVVTVEMGCAVSVAAYPMTGRQVKEAAVPDTMTLAQELGHILRRTQAADGDIVAAVVNHLHGFRVFVGKVVDVNRRTAGGFSHLEARLEGIDDDGGLNLLVRSQNEHLLAVRDGQLAASTPDLIIMLDLETGRPITTERVRYGYRLAVIGVPCDSRWRTSAGLELVGPSYFGYDVAYVPVEELSRDRAS